MNKVKIAKGFLAAYMKLCGFKGWASLWNTVYILPGYRNNAVILQHEFIHLEQMKRDGKFMFLLKYIGWFLIKGYHNHPYEVEARTSSLLK